MSKSTTTKTKAQAEREERIKRTRAKRIEAIHVEIEKAKTGITTQEIASATGYTKGTVLSTMKLVNRTVAAIAGEVLKADKAMYAYRPKAGWVIAAKWEERAKWHRTLHRHALTRCESLKAEADVAQALWHGDAPGGLSEQYATAIYALDRAGDLIGKLDGDAGKSPKPKPVKRGVRMIG